MRTSTVRGQLSLFTDAGEQAVYRQQDGPDVGMSDIEKVTGASPSLAHESGPAPVAGTVRGFTADDHTYLQAQVDEITGVLVGRGYLDIAQTPAEAVREVAADAAEAQRAREVLFADEVLEEEHDIAGPAVNAEGPGPSRGRPGALRHHSSGAAP